MNFEPFQKIARLRRDCVITEKIDGTNAQIYIVTTMEVSEPKAIASWLLPHGGSTHMFAGSRGRWITPTDDNFGFAKWAKENADTLSLLGPGRHFGEWWGQGVQRGYGQDHKIFSLFNTGRWNLAENPPPPCCGIVPILYRGLFTSEVVWQCIQSLQQFGSVVAPGFMNPEGVVVYHFANQSMFKQTIEKDDAPKGKAA